MALINFKPRKKGKYRLVASGPAMSITSMKRDHEKRRWSIPLFSCIFQSGHRFWLAFLCLCCRWARDLFKQRQAWLEASVASLISGLRIRNWRNSSVCVWEREKGWRGKGMHECVGRRREGKGSCLCVRVLMLLRVHRWTRLVNPSWEFNHQWFPLRRKNITHSEESENIRWVCNVSPSHCFVEEVKWVAGRECQEREKGKKVKGKRQGWRKGKTLNRKEDETTKEDGGGEKEVINNKGRMRKKREGKERRGERGCRGAILWVLR